MKRLLVVSATAAEISPFTAYLDREATLSGPGIYRLGALELQLCISGVGLMATAFRLGALMAVQHFDLALQAGIAGCFDQQIPLGTLLRVGADRYGDLGAEDHDNYIDITEMGFLDPNAFPFEEGWLPASGGINLGSELAAVKGISVNTVSGNAATIARRSRLFGATVESMEGAAFHYACRLHSIPFVQLRAISNYVTPRDRSSWQIGPALGRLNDYLIQHIAGTGTNNKLYETNTGL